MGRILLALAAVALVSCGESAIQVEHLSDAGASALATGGAAGTGGSAVMACGSEYDGRAPQTYDHRAPQAGVFWCGRNLVSNQIRVRYSNEGAECVTCLDSAQKVFFGCSLRVPSLKDPKVNADAVCASTCVACRVERCFSTGSDYGAEVPCS